MKYSMNTGCDQNAMGVDQRRRRLIAGLARLAAIGAAPLAGCGGGSMMSDGTLAVGLRNDPITPSTSGRSLPIVALDEGVMGATGSREFLLRVQRGSARLLDGVDSATLGYNGPLLGPALRLRTGESTRIRVRNDLEEATTVHWHGLVVPAAFDGGPHQSIAPGATWEAAFTVVNPTSTCWFHPHAHGSTGRQVISGLTGLLIVDDAATATLALPHEWGVDDLALVLQDKRFTAAGQIDYNLTADDLINGYAGDRLFVNGVAGAVWQAPAQWVRLRLLNSCNARALTLQLSDSVPMLQIANEGGFLASPLVRSSITLWPGERAEVLVDLGRVAFGRDLTLYAAGANGGDGMAGMGGMGMGGMGVGGLGLGRFASSAEVNAMTIRVNRPRQAGAISTPPDRLSATPAPVAAAAAPVRTFNLDGGMMSSVFTINGRSFDMTRVDFTVAARTVEVWRFVNRTAMAHPMHVHGVHMSLLSRDGAAPAAHERGLRDTFVVEPMQTVSVAVQTPAAASQVPLMLHCHNLEHEDSGMMGQFVAA